MSERYLDAVVLGRQDLTDRVCELTLGAADGRPLPMAEAGSHIELRFGGADGRFLRHYSVVGPLTLRPEAEPFWRIAVQREDRARGSAHIHDTFRAGQRLRVSHPIGAFRLSRAPHSLLVAGGIGITPILPMLRSLVVRGQEVEMAYLGGSTGAMAYTAEVAAIGGDRVRIHESDIDGPLDLVGLLGVQPESTIAYVCGPVPLITAVEQAAERLGWPPERVRFEVFNAAHHVDDTDFRVRVADRLVHVRAGTTILDALEMAGVDTLSDCRRGECGLCLTTVLDSGEGIDHRDHYMTDDERTGDRRMTICCSRARGDEITLALD